MCSSMLLYIISTVDFNTRPFQIQLLSGLVVLPFKVASLLLTISSKKSSQSPCPLWSSASEVCKLRNVAIFNMPNPGYVALDFGGEVDATVYETTAFLIQADKKHMVEVKNDIEMYKLKKEDVPATEMNDFMFYHMDDDEWSHWRSQFQAMNIDICLIFLIALSKDIAAKVYNPICLTCSCEKLSHNFDC